MEDCIFCKIVKGELPCYKLYEDDNVLVFLDIHPLTKGHSLVIPKQHAENIFDISADSLKEVALTAQKMSAKIKEALRADGIRLSQSNGKSAGQEVMHFHLHIIPRYEGEEIKGNMASTASGLPQADFEELNKIAEQINNYS